MATETAAEKKKREAKEAAAAKAKAEKEANAKVEEQKKADADPLKAQKEAEKNDVDPEKAPLISTKHDEVIKEKLAHGSSKEAREAEAENYRKQQERQAALERDTQRGLGFDGVRGDGKK